VSRRSFAWFLSFAAFVLPSLGGAGDARAASNDKEVEALIESVLQSDYAAGNFKQGLEQLEFGKQACEGTSCSPSVRGKLYVAIGTVLLGMKKAPEARAAFAAALKEDPSAKPFTSFTSPEVTEAFNAARPDAAPGPGPGDTGTPSATPKPPAPATPAAPRKPKKTWPGSGRPPRGWRSSEAFFYYNEAFQSEAAREWLDCVDYAQASLQVDDRGTTRFLAASCEERAGLWIEALADFQTVAESAGKTGLYDVAKQAKARAQTLRDKIPKLVIRRPAKADDVTVRLNGQEIAPDKLDGEIWVNPGQRTIQAKGRVNGVELEFEQAIDAAEFETSTVEIKLGPKGAKGDTAMMRCMLAAASREDFAKCLNAGSGLSLNVHAGTELSAYHDSDHVDVITPAFLAGVESPTGGWGVNASFLVDMVTAASTDIVATASPRWREVRYVPSIGGHKKLGDADVSLKGNLSHEPDYLASSLGAAFSIDLRQKTITPALGYEFSYDVSGRAGTPFSVFSHSISRHGIDASVTFVLDKSTIFAGTFTAVLENGDTSKPYRYIPMFDPEVAKRVPIGLSIDGVNKNRLPIRALEQLPTSRQRWAIAGLLAHRFASSTLRAEERLYVDNWGLKASTTDAQYLVDLNDRLRLWPQLRFNVQSAASFWQLAYAAPVDKKDPTVFAVPALRTGDRELGPLWGITLGGGARLAFGEKKAWAVSVLGDLVYTRFLDHLFLLDRLGFFGATTLEVDFE
jgi:tetratricopeptide (TPR) repeat protein